MMNKKGFELAISTLILMIIGILVLIGLIIALNGGFDRFNKNTESIFDSTEGSAAKQACELSCAAEDLLGYCCNEYEISGKEYSCLDVPGNECELSCAAVSCPN